MTAMALEKALSRRARDYEDALDVVERLAEEALDAGDANDSERRTTARAARALAEATYLVACLRRLVRGRSVEEIHAAFGAPGDYGYETLIGDALARVYGLRGDDEKKGGAP